MNKFVKLPLYLAIVGAITTLALSVVYHITNPIIQEQKIAQEKASLVELFANADFELGVEFKQADKKLGLDKMFIAKVDNKPVAYIYKTITVGYHGDVVTLVSISPEGVFNGYKVLDASSETAGIGSKVKDKVFYEQFLNEDINTPIMPLDGATKTTGPVVKAIEAAVTHFKSTYIKP